MTFTVKDPTSVDAFLGSCIDHGTLSIAAGTRVSVYDIHYPHGVVRMVAGGSEDPIVHRPEYDPVHGTFDGYRVVRVL